MKLIFIAAMLISVSGIQSAYAACEWEYRIVNLDSPDALTERANTKESARSGLEQSLQRLGRGNWELASQHKIQERLEGDPARPNAKGVWVYELDPPVALFKKQICN